MKSSERPAPDAACTAHSPSFHTEAYPSRYTDIKDACPVCFDGGRIPLDLEWIVVGIAADYYHKPKATHTADDIPSGSTLATQLADPDVTSVDDVNFEEVH